MNAIEQLQQSRGWEGGLAPALLITDHWHV